jgi:hypothetical protein
MTTYTIIETDPKHDSFGRIKFGIINSLGYCVKTELSREAAEAAIGRKLATGTFDHPISEAQVQTYLNDFARRLEDDSAHGFTRD